MRYVILAIITMGIGFVLPSVAFADCAPNGADIVCTGVDADGYDTSATENIIVEPGAVVQDAILVGGNSTVTNNGSITANDDAIGAYEANAITIVNNGSISGDDDAQDGLIFASGGNDDITNTGTIDSSVSGVAISAMNGNDTVTILAGSTVIGVIHGGFGNMGECSGPCESDPSEVDTFKMVGNTFDAAGWAAFQACVDNPASCSDPAIVYSIALDGKTYQFQDFEAFINALLLLVGDGGGGGGDGGGGETLSSLLQPASVSTCDNELMKVFRTTDGFIQVYSGFWLFPPNGFLVAVFHELDAQVGKVFTQNNPAFPRWSVEIAQGGKLILRDENGAVISNNC